MSALIICAHADHAFALGFRQGAQHREGPGVFCWYPGRGIDAIRGIRFDLVVVTDGARVYSAADYSRFAELRHILTSRPPGPVWLEL